MIRQQPALQLDSGAGTGFSERNHAHSTALRLFDKRATDPY